LRNGPEKNDWTVTNRFIDDDYFLNYIFKDHGQSRRLGTDSDPSRNKTAQD